MNAGGKQSNVDGVDSTFTVLERLPQAYVCLDADFRHTFVNAAAARTLGVNPESLMGKTAWEVAPDADLADVQRAYRQVQATGVPMAFETRVGRRERWFEVSLSPAADRGLLVHFADITARKRAESALVEREDQYRQLFDHMHEGLAYFRVIFEAEVPRDLVFLMVNKRFEALTGFTDVVGKRISEIRPNMLDEDAALLSIYAEVARTGVPRRFEYYIRGIGEWFSVSTFSPMRDRFVAMFENISERKRAESALKTSEDRFYRMVQANPAAIAIIDYGTRRLAFVNETFERASGYSRNELVGRRLDEEIAFWADRRERREIARAFFRDGRRLRNREGRFRRKNGSLFVGLISTEMLEIDGNLCVMSAIIDTTELREVQKQLLQSQKLESVGRLAGGVAHDFNNLLTVVNGYSAMLLARLEADSLLHSFAREVNEAGERAAILTRQLLAFSRKQRSSPRSLNLNTIVEEAERMLGRLIGEDIRMVTSLDPHLGQVMADPGQMHQVLANLLVNARDAMPSGGLIEIETRNIDAPTRHRGVRRHSGYVMLSVRDTGIGMDADTLQSAFEPFFTTKQRGEGTGLGLSTVYGIVRQSGGWIDAWSESGKGATFHVFLPRTHVLPADVDAPAAAPARSAGETVLVVEDDSAVATLTTALLEAQGYGVLGASNAAAALDVATHYQGRIDLLLTDVVMPDMNGKLLAQEIRKRRHDIKVLFMSGYPADVLGTRGMLEPGIQYLPKPFTESGLTTKVREALRNAAKA